MTNEISKNIFTLPPKWHRKQESNQKIGWKLRMVLGKPMRIQFLEQSTNRIAKWCSRTLFWHYILQCRKVYWERTNPQLNADESSSVSRLPLSRSRIIFGKVIRICWNIGMKMWTIGENLWTSVALRLSRTWTGRNNCQRVILEMTKKLYSSYIYDYDHDHWPFSLLYSWIIMQWFNFFN